MHTTWRKQAWRTRACSSSYSLVGRLEWAPSEDDVFSESEEEEEEEWSAKLGVCDWLKCEELGLGLGLENEWLEVEVQNRIAEEEEELQVLMILKVLLLLIDRNVIPKSRFAEMRYIVNLCDVKKKKKRMVITENTKRKKMKKVMKVSTKCVIQ